ncbi:MAG: hypothetical protein H6Q72_3734 [Firmicutes bacterium]|nr:hypothetical protein [Bacillota bacterium]
MKPKLFISLLSLSVLILAATPAGAEKSHASDTDLAPLKADDKRVEKLRHGYITYNGNRMYYHW